MTRRLFTLCSALSLLLCAAACVLWVRGYSEYDLARAGYWNFRPHPGSRAYLDADMLLALHCHGHWEVAVVRRPRAASTNRRPAGPGRGGRRWEVGAAPDNWDWDEGQKACWGFTTPPPATLGFRRGSGMDHRAVEFPDWAVAAFTAVLPACWLAGTLRRWPQRLRRVRLGACPACGYDLRASPGRCPECGAEVISPASV